MARKVTVTLLDDMDETQEAEQTIEFSWEGRSYEIDLSNKNAAKFAKQMEPWVEHSRRSKNGVSAPKRRSNGTQLHSSESKAIREWAVENGMQVNNRGRISAEVVEAYRAAQDAQ